ncbi:MAG: GNAT family N-acetyltransferase [Rhizobiales bacterium]|nr:GNAT family N-acetyltransferase [Hyphomicrobiales bacterium]
MENMVQVTIRPFAARDRAAWDRLWAGYLTFYKSTLTPEVSDNTWARILDPAGEIIGLMAVDADDAPVGFAHAIPHAGTWDPRPVCYLEDLFVAPEARGSGAGRALIEALAEKGRAEGWLRLYWQTASDNDTAQALYKKLAEKTDWVRFDLDL